MFNNSTASSNGNALPIIARKLYELNIINGRSDLIREFIANLIGVDYFSIDQSIIDEEIDVEVLADVLSQLTDLFCGRGYSNGSCCQKFS